MSTSFCGITEAIPSLFRGIFSKRNSVANPILSQIEKKWITVYYITRIENEIKLVGLGTEFRSEKIPRNRLGMASVIPRKKVLIPRHSEFRGSANSEARNGTERTEIPLKNEVLRKSLNTAQNIF